ncbi:nuclear transport factor 2 family protein [Kitasatospora sp. NPDC052868]|uniref:nuclear transport factor 2 family protein n=1 Tax=Kitasatospora sp. NPDC052868 TaxID=3364060 RepID=UPI0037C96536
MDQQLVERMREYLDAGLAMDVEALDALYDEEFENLRVDGAGRSVTLTKARFMARFRAMKEQGVTVGESIDDVTFVATTAYGGVGSIIMRREEGGVPALYNFVWRQEDGRWTTLLREFTVDRDLSGLLAMVRSAQAAGAA